MGVVTVQIVDWILERPTVVWPDGVNRLALVLTAYPPGWVRVYEVDCERKVLSRVIDVPRDRLHELLDQVGLEQLSRSSADIVMLGDSTRAIRVGEPPPPPPRGPVTTAVGAHVVSMGVLATSTNVALFASLDYV